MLRVAWKAFAHHVEYPLTKSVSVDPGMSCDPDRPLVPSEPNHLPLVARFETSWLDIHARVSLRVILPFMPI